MEEEATNKQETNSLPSEYQSDCCDDPEQLIKESYTKIQRVIDVALPLLPTRIKDNMNQAKSQLEGVIVNYIKQLEAFDFLSNKITYAELLEKV